MQQQMRENLTKLLMQRIVSARFSSLDTRYYVVVIS